jgi:ribonuclease HII
MSKTLICGIDEAGRGPLAGPVYAAAVILSDTFPKNLLDDSKKLSEKKRLELEPLIKNMALGWSLAWADHREIDYYNILQASFLAMERAISSLPWDKLGDVSIKVMIDGNRKPRLPFESEAIVNGDSLIPEISAASILAKNERDRWMLAYHEMEPVYNYKQHKGYPTKAHRELVKIHGPSKIQRLSFRF